MKASHTMVSYKYKKARVLYYSKLSLLTKLRKKTVCGGWGGGAQFYTNILLTFGGIVVDY